MRNLRMSLPSRCAPLRLLSRGEEGEKNIYTLNGVCGGGDGRALRTVTSS